MKIYICYILLLIIAHANALPVDLNKIKNQIIKKNGEIEQLIEQLIRLSNKNEETQIKENIDDNKCPEQNSQTSEQLSLGDNQTGIQSSNQDTNQDAIQNVNKKIKSKTIQNNQNSAQIAIGNNQTVTQISNQITKTVNIVRNVNRSG